MWTEPKYCPDCHEPESLCQCGDPIARPSYDELKARLAEVERDWSIEIEVNGKIRAERDQYKARLAEAERLLALKLPAGVEVNRVWIGKGCDLRTLASAIAGPFDRTTDSAEHRESVSP